MLLVVKGGHRRVMGCGVETGRGETTSMREAVSSCAEGLQSSRRILQKQRRIHGPLMIP